MLWRASLSGVRLLRLVLLLQAAAAVVTLGGLVAFGRDGRMATHGLMVLAVAVALGWALHRRRLWNNAGGRCFELRWSAAPACRAKGVRATRW